MSSIYDNWERLVAATLKREQLRDLALCESFSSRASDVSFGSSHDDIVVSLVSSNEWKLDDLVGIEGAPEALLKLIEEPISLTTTKASLSAISELVVSSATFSNKSAAAYFAEIGIVPVLTEFLMGSERSMCERALGVLDGICNCSEGIEKAYENPRTVPVLVKKMLCVSELATEFSVSILWKLIKNENRGGQHACPQALELGAFKKLILLLQMDFSETTKKKITELLKVMIRVEPTLLAILQKPFTGTYFSFKKRKSIWGYIRVIPTA